MWCISKSSVQPSVERHKDTAISRPRPNEHLTHASQARHNSSSEPSWETFDNIEQGYIYDPLTSSADAEKALKDLLSQSMNEITQDIDMKLAVVDGFREDVRLLPHQVVGRIWMKERESGKKLGGILADDMG